MCVPKCVLILQVDCHYLHVHLWRYVSDENLVAFLLDEIVVSVAHRCLDPVLMEGSIVELIAERSWPVSEKLPFPSPTAQSTKRIRHIPSGFYHSISARIKKNSFKPTRFLFYRNRLPLSAINEVFRWAELGLLRTEAICVSLRLEALWVQWNSFATGNCWELASQASPLRLPQSLQMKGRQTKKGESYVRPNRAKSCCLLNVVLGVLRCGSRSSAWFQKVWPSSNCCSSVVMATKGENILWLQTFPAPTVFQTLNRKGRIRSKPLANQTSLRSI